MTDEEHPPRAIAFEAYPLVYLARKRVGKTPFIRPLARTFSNWAADEVTFKAVAEQIQLSRHPLTKHWAFGGGDGNDREGLLVLPGRGPGGDALCFRVSIQRHEDNADSAIIVAQPDQGVPKERAATEKRGAADQPVDSELMLRALLDVLPLGATIRDESGRLLFANAFLTRAESQGDPSSAGKAWAKRQADVDRQVFADGTSVDYTAETGKGEGQRFFHCFVFLLPDAPTHERRVATLIVDITSQKLVAIEAQMLSERRRKFLEVQREFISMVSHEFRTPMTTIHGAQYLVEKLFKKLAKSNTSGAENLERWLGMQASALATLRTLVDQVLMLNRTEHMTGQTSLEFLSPGEVLDETVERINDPMDEPRVVLTNDVPEEFAASLDPALVRAAAENLISNGLKYSAADAQVNVHVYTESNGWVLEVADKGRGIPAADQASLFKPFFRAANVGAVPGTGLGLAIVRRAVDFHGGHIIFESDTKSGTRFELHFPNVTVRRDGEIRSGSAPLMEGENFHT